MKLLPCTSHPQTFQIMKQWTKFPSRDPPRYFRKCIGEHFIMSPSHIMLVLFLLRLMRNVRNEAETETLLCPSVF